MNDLNVPAEQAEREPSVWADISAELHKLAEDVLTLVGEPAPHHFGIDILTHNPTHRGPDTAESRPVTIAAVDAAGVALLGKPGEVNAFPGGICHYEAKGQRGPIDISVFQSVARSDDRDAELARLRAENEQLRAAARQAYVREAAPEDGALTTPEVTS